MRSCFQGSCAEGARNGVYSIDLICKVNAWFQFAGFRGRPILGQRKKLTVPSASKRPLRLYIPAVTKAASLFRSWKSKTKRRLNANWRSPSINRVLLKNLMANTGKSPTINQVLLSKVLWIYSITSRPTKFVTNHYKKRDLVNINCSYQWQRMLQVKGESLEMTILIFSEIIKP